MVYIGIVSIVMASIVMASIVMAYIVMAYIVLAYIVMALCTYGLYSYGLYSYGPAAWRSRCACPYIFSGVRRRTNRNDKLPKWCHERWCLVNASNCDIGPSKAPLYSYGLIYSYGHERWCPVNASNCDIGSSKAPPRP